MAVFLAHPTPLATSTTWMLHLSLLCGDIQICTSLEWNCMTFCSDTRSCRLQSARFFYFFLFFLIKHFTTVHLISVCFNRLISDSYSSSLLLSVSFTFFSQNKMAPNSIHWFRKGLRLHDNPALREAIRGAGTVRCVYFLDPWFAGSSNVGVNRWR